MHKIKLPFLHFHEYFVGRSNHAISHIFEDLLQRKYNTTLEHTATEKQSLYLLLLNI